MKSALVAAFLLMTATPAFAALAPQYYLDARTNAADVVVINVVEVGPPPAIGHGPCAVKGIVASVERGTTYSVGQEIIVAVHCRLPNAPMMVGAVQWKSFEALSAAPAGRAFLNDGVLALYQYDVLTEAPAAAVE